MSNNTATVEALTAEVKALMVGNRQVTLSVYRQLDTIPYTDIEPFGRVHDSKDSNGNRDTVFVVGRNLVDGNLSRSFQRPPNWHGAAPREFEHLAFHSSKFKIDQWNPVYGSDDDGVLLWCPDRHFCGTVNEFVNTYKEPKFWTDEHDLWEWLKAEHRYRARQGEFCDKTALLAKCKEKAIQQHTAITDERTRYECAKALPLIVLAGLR